MVRVRLRLWLRVRCCTVVVAGAVLYGCGAVRLWCVCSAVRLRLWLLLRLRLWCCGGVMVQVRVRLRVRCCTTAVAVQ
jgi:hypothetical protein